MAHSHDKTLLARLGFQDPDAKDPLHDLACEYMALEENVLKLQEIVDPVPDVTIGEDVTSELGFEPDEGDFNFRFTEVVSSAESHIESVLTKGMGQYMTTVGFIDVDARWRVVQKRVGTMKLRHEQVRKVDDRHYNGRIVIEVKISSITVGDVARQMNLYRSHILAMGDYRSKFVVAAAFDVNEYYRSALERENVTIVRLGERFGVWAREKANSASAKVPQF